MKHKIIMGLLSLFVFTSCVQEFDLVGEYDYTAEIKYTTIDNKPISVNIKGQNYWTYNSVVSNYYNNGIGTILLSNESSPVYEAMPDDFCDEPTLTSISIPDGISGFSGGALNNCSRLRKVTIEDGTSAFWFNIDVNRDIDYFKNSPIEELYIGRFVDYGYLISYDEDGILFHLASLNTLTLGNRVTNLYINFSNCNKLTEIYCKAINPPYLEYKDFGQNLRKIYVPMDAIESYKNSDSWSQYADKIEGYDFSE